MLSIRDHDVEDYAALRHMDTTDVGVLNEDDRECLREIGEYLVASDVWQRFGIWLLHKHFEPDAGEVFVERVIPGPRRTETRPADRSVFSLNGLNATAMRFEGAAGSGVGVVGMEFAEPGDFGRSAPLSAEDEAALAGIVERLEAHSKTDRFGVRLIRDPLELSKQEVMLETCDSANRTLH